MTSKITIEMDFETSSPCIRIVNDTDSDDVRDKLIKFFTEKLGHTSSWCRAKFAQYPPSDRNGILTLFIHPITPAQMEEEAKAMQEQADMLKKFPEQTSVSH